jgi:hypothetical protein
MSSVPLALRLNERVLPILDRVRDKVPRETYVQKMLAEVGAQMVTRWNFLQARGEVAIDPQGQVVVRLADLRPLVLGPENPTANVRVRFPPVIFEHIQHAAEISSAIKTRGGGAPYPSVLAFCEDYLVDAIALKASEADMKRAREAARAQAEEELLEAERARRRAHLESGGDPPEAEPESTSEAPSAEEGFSPSSGPVVGLELEDPSSDGS